jgi:hypothetical protein
MATAVGLSSSPQNIAGLTSAGDYIIRFYNNTAPGTGCSTAFDDVKVTVSRAASAANAGTDQVLACGIMNTALAGNTIATGQGIGRWVQVSGPSIATFSNQFLPTSSVSNLVAGDYVFRWVVNNGGNCPLRSDDVNITVRQPPVAIAGPDQGPICYGVGVQLSGSPLARRQNIS